MSRSIRVSIDWQGDTLPVGTLWVRARGGKEIATFEYLPEWLKDPNRFPITPMLTLDTGPHHSGGGGALLGALSDSAPDRWGRKLMLRNERRLGEAEGRAPRTLQELDFLLGVHDVTRMGALRFSEDEDSPFLAEDTGNAVPPLVELPRLLNASERVVNEEENDDDIRLLLAPGTSLGGARPKTSVFDRVGNLCIAKFPSPKDDWPTEQWESVALSLARVAGVETPVWSMERVQDQPILILQRFDRLGTRRIPFLSAMSMLGAHDHETRCYLEIVDALRRGGSQPRNDMHALFRRMVFNIMISNTDDHLRNHAFLLHDNQGWRLSPAYDLNPVPVDVRPRELSTEIDLGNATASVDLAMSVVEYFDLTDEEAMRIVGEVARPVSRWRAYAEKMGLTKQQIERMKSAFEHEDLNTGVRFAEKV